MCIQHIQHAIAMRALQLDSKIVQRENSHGNQESCEEGGEETREEGRKEEVTTFT
jgi:hypothetical protein